MVGANLDVDIPHIEKFYDILIAEAGELCPQCGKPLKVTRGIEVGNIFKLGTKYSKPMNAVSACLLPPPTPTCGCRTWVVSDPACWVGQGKALGRVGQAFGILLAGAPFSHSSAPCPQPGSLPAVLFLRICPEILLFYNHLIFKYTLIL